MPTSRGERRPLAPAGSDFLLDPEVAYLNHGSFGACPRPVFDIWREWQARLEREPVLFLDKELPEFKERARAALAAFLGAQAADLVFVPNATHGVNIVAKSMRFGPGDEVLATDHEYGACDRVWRYLSKLRGFDYFNRRLPLPFSDPDELVERFWEGVTPRTKMIFLSHISSPTALTLPIREICRRAREAGIPTLIDGAHAPGQLELDLESIGADYYTGNCHKWLCAPKGAAFLHARRDRQGALEPLVVGWGWESESPGESRFQDLFAWTGTDDPSAVLSVPTAISFQEEHDWPAVREACHALLASAERRISQLTGLPALSASDGGWWSQMRAIPLPPGDAAALQTALWQDYRVEVPIIAWQGRRLLRVSVQAYNAEEDIDRLVEGLRSLLEAEEAGRGARISTSG